LNTVTIVRALFAAVFAMSVAVGTAGPTAAVPVEEPMYGIYTYHQEGWPEETWTIYATCVPAGCVLHVATLVSPNLGPNSDFPGYGGDARKVNGLWTLMLPKEKGAKCPDGSWASVNYTYAWDQATLAGTLTKMHGEVCGLQPAAEKVPFTLSYKEPLPIPIILDPLNQIENLW
jgi:hypothetical protein